MKVLLKPVTEHGREVVVPNLEKLGLIFSKPALRFMLKTTIPKKYKRAVIGFSLEKTSEGIYYLQKDSDNSILKKVANRKKVFLAIEELIIQCDGVKEDFKFIYEGLKNE